MGTASALPPRRLSSSANAPRRSSRRAPSTRLAPCAERNRAVASPSPLLAPVMTTTFPSMLLLMVLVPALHDGRSWSFAPALFGLLVLADLFRPNQRSSHSALPE